jgi:flagellar protein FliL
MPEEPEGVEKPEEENNEESASGKKSQLSSIIPLAGIVVIAIIGAFLLTNMVLKPMFSKSKVEAVNTNHDEPEKKKTEKKKEKKKDSKGGGHGGEQSSEGEGGAGNFLQIEGIVVNPAATGGSRFLSTTIGFEFDDSENYDLFKGEEIKIRDALISILSSKTVTELADAPSRESLRRQILKTVNKICEPAKADAIYFVDFVLQ